MVTDQNTHRKLRSPYFIKVKWTPVLHLPRITIEFSSIKLIFSEGNGIRPR